LGVADWVAEGVCEESKGASGLKTGEKTVLV